MKTALLDRTAWDLVLDAAGNVAVAADPYSIAQDCASAIRLFLGEPWYDTTKGIPYFQQILGKPLSTPFLKAQVIKACLTVPQVTGAVCYINALPGRALSGQVQITYAVQAPAPHLTWPTSPPDGRALIFFIGDNGGVLTFVGDTGGVVDFYGEI